MRNDIANAILSTVLMAIFPSRPALASTRMSLFWILLELRVMEVMVATGAIDVQRSNQIVTTNKPTPNFLQAGCPSRHPTNSVEAQMSLRLTSLLLTDRLPLMSQQAAIYLVTQAKNYEICAIMWASSVESIVLWALVRPTPPAYTLSYANTVMYFGLPNLKENSTIHECLRILKPEVATVNVK